MGSWNPTPIQEFPPSWLGALHRGQFWVSNQVLGEGLETWHKGLALKWFFQVRGQRPLAAGPGTLPLFSLKTQLCRLQAQIQDDPDSPYSQEEALLVFW